MTLYMWIATIAWLAMCLGFAVRRRNRLLHVRCMLYCITSDVLLVIFLEITRHAVEKAASFTLNYNQQIHIGFSLCAMLLYAPAVYLGRKIYLGNSDPRIRLIHRRVGYGAFLLRSLGFLFMFSMWKS